MEFDKSAESILLIELNKLQDQLLLVEERMAFYKYTVVLPTINDMLDKTRNQLIYFLAGVHTLQREIKYTEPDQQDAVGVDKKESGSKSAKSMCEECGVACGKHVCDRCVEEHESEMSERETDDEMELELYDSDKDECMANEPYTPSDLFMAILSRCKPDDITLPTVFRSVVKAIKETSQGIKTMYEVSLLSADEIESLPDTEAIHAYWGILLDKITECDDDEIEQELKDIMEMYLYELGVAPLCSAIIP